MAAKILVEHVVGNIDLGTLEPLPRVDEEPDNDDEHRRAVHQTRPVHQLQREIGIPHRREAQDRHHDEHKRRRQDPGRHAEPAEVPRAPAEVAANIESLDGDGQGEGDKGGDGTDGEDGADGHAAKDEEVQQDADERVEPDGVDRGLCVPVDLLQRSGDDAEAVVARVGEADPRGCHHAALSHHERADDGHRQNGHGHGLREDLDEISSPRLTLHFVSLRLEPRSVRLTRSVLITSSTS